MANPEHVELMKRGAKAVREWREKYPDVRLDLNRADLSRADLVGAHLVVADLDWADLSGADLSGADLFGANLRGANLRGADVSKAVFGFTILGDVDLSEAKGLEIAVHLAPSTIGVDTLLKSKGKIPVAFLRGCGVPETVIQNVTGLFGKALDFYSCFISYAEPDDRFSKRLYNDLQGEGIRCWRWREDSRWGSKLMKGVDQAIRRYDKLILICSKASLQSEPVVREIERALQKEQRDGKDVLFPITLDRYVFDWDHELAADVQRKHIGQFSRRAGTKKYDEALKRLVRDLRKGERR